MSTASRSHLASVLRPVTTEESASRLRPAGRPGTRGRPPGNRFAMGSTAGRSATKLFTTGL